MRSGSKQKRRRNTWFISAPLKERLNEAISDVTSDYSIWRECYRHTGSLRGVVVLHTILVNIANNQSKQEVLERISLWPRVGRMLFAILLSKLEMHGGITSELEFCMGHHMKGLLNTYDPIKIVTEEIQNRLAMIIQRPLTVCASNPTNTLRIRKAVQSYC